jgi:hypothetical protein
MEYELWKAIVIVLARLSKLCCRPRATYSDDRIVEVYYWAVIHDRPQKWACDKTNWPIWLRKKRLPSPSQLSRRLRCPRVVARLAELERYVVRPRLDCLVWFIDGKPLVTGGCSKDRQASYGRGAACIAKGYKLHAIVDQAQNVAIWRVAPMNVDERKMAKRLLKQAKLQGYIIADANYDSNELFKLCDEQGNQQWVAPRRHGGPQRGFSPRPQTQGRLRCKELLENPFAEFGKGLMNLRTGIERCFGNLTNWGGGLTHLPPWVRTIRRVRLWVQAKLILTTLKRSCQLTTYNN